MFTGIVEELGTLRSLTVGTQSAVVEVGAQAVLEGTVEFYGKRFTLSDESSCSDRSLTS